MIEVDIMACFNCNSANISKTQGSHGQTIIQCFDCYSMFIQNSAAVNKIIAARNLLTKKSRNDIVDTMAKIRQVAIKKTEEYQKNSIEKIQEKQKVIPLHPHPRRGPKTTEQKTERISFRLSEKTYKALKKKCATFGEKNPNLGARKILEKLLKKIISEDENTHGNTNSSNED